jgi:serine/threonine-protein kinase
VSDRELDRYEGLTLADQVVIDRLSSRYEMALRRGEDPSLEEYLQKAGVSDPACLLIELVAIDRVYRSSGSLSRDDYVARFPDFAAAIDEAFQSNSVTRVRPSPQSPHREVSTPPAIDGYEILGELGRGGMGVVYKARHRGLRRLVAVKVILAARLGSGTGHARLRLEAELAARVQHPNIVAVHEVGSHADGPFLSMEWVQGGTLAGHAGQPWPANLAADLVRTLARAVHAAHNQGVIHRDLKPANVLLQELPDGAAVAGAVTLPGGGLVVPKVADFSLALLVESGENLTSTGQVMGTPAYMAPEQARGERARVGPATDVYALGVILYELLTGRLPFRADDPMGLLLAITTDDPRPPRRLRPQVPRDLDTVCMKCLEKEPDRRYASAAALADDLARFLEDRSILAQRPTFREAAARWARRHRTVVWAAAVLLLAVTAIGGGVGLREAQKGARAKGEAQAALTEALELQQREKWPEALSAVRRAKGVLVGVWVDESLRREVEELDRDVEMALRLQEARLRAAAGKGFEGAICAAYEEAFTWYGLDVDQLDPRQAGEFIRSRSTGLQLAAALDDWAFWQRERRKRWLHLLAISRVADPDPWRNRLRDALEGKDHKVVKELVASARADELPSATVVLLARMGRKSAEARTVEEVLRQAQRRRPDDFWLNHHLGWGCLYDFRPARLEEAIRYYSMAVALRPQSPGARMNLGLALYDKGRLDDAIAEHREAIRLDPHYPNAHTSLGVALQAKGKVDEAIACWRKAIDLDPKHIAAHNNLGASLCDVKRDYDGAIACFKKAIALAPKHAGAHSNLGNALYGKGKVEEAIACYKKAIEIDPKLAWAHSGLGNALLGKGQVDEAMACFHKAIDIDPKFAAAYVALGNALQGKGQVDEAIACFHKAIDLDPKFASAHYNLGNALQGKGRVEEAIACYKKAIALDPKVAEAHCNLGHALARLCRFAESLAALKRGHELGRKQPGWSYPSAQWVRQAERMAALEAKLPAFLKGEFQPTSTTERLDLAGVCQARKLYHATTRLYADAFAAEPRLVANLQGDHRSNAARSAALAAAGNGEDAARLDDKERTRLRQQALDWLNADLAISTKLMASGPANARLVVQQRLNDWQKDSDLAGLRDQAALAKLQAAEREQWQQFWAEVVVLADDPLGQGCAHAARRQWRRAADCYARALKRGPTDEGHFWFEYACVLLLSGDRPGYTKACAGMVEMFAKARALRAYHVARACTLGPDSVADAAWPERLARAELSRNAREFWSLTQQGALQYRAGHFKEAVALLEQSLRAEPKSGRAVVNWLWLALAQHRLGKPEEARRWLSRAQALLDQYGDGMPARADEELGLHLHNWLEAHVLRREAEALLGSRKE